MFPRPRYHAQERRAMERGNEIRTIAGAIARLLDAGNTRNEWRRTPPRSFRDTPYTRKRTPRFYGYQTRERAWPRRPPRARPEDPRGPACCPGEALLWQSSEYPDGANMTNGKRGSLVGNNPEALRGEAPKGQPMIRGENLLDVCVEAREVSQGTTDAIPDKSCEDQWGKTRW